MTDQPPSDKPALTIMGFEAHRLRIEPGDALVLHSPDLLSQAARTNATEALRDFLRMAGMESVPFVVLDRGWRFSVIGKADLERAGLTAENVVALPVKP